MGGNESYKTAYLAANARLIEQFEPKEKRLFNDALVKIFFSKYISNLLKIDVFKKLFIFSYNLTSTGLYGLQVCRTKYIDDRVIEALNEGMEQLVILGSGFDTRAYRIPNINKLKVFEVDLPIMINKKKSIIEKYLEKSPSNVIFTAIDFNVQSLEEVLKSSSLDFSKPIFFIWEGVTPYLTEEGVRSTLKFISKAPSGSKLVFTYILKSLLDGTSNMLGGESLFKMGDQLLKFGLTPKEVQGFIKPYNLTLIEDVGASYYVENYLKPIDRKLALSEIERIVYAKI
jgi:methyltransferase (TIGR00027 family)